MAITGTFKGIQGILDELFGAGKDPSTIEENYYNKLKSLAGKAVTLNGYNVEDLTFEVNDKTLGIIRERFSINILEPTIDFSDSDLLYGRCGFMPSGSSKYAYAPRYTWDEIVAGQSAIDEEAARTQLDGDGNLTPRAAISESEKYYQDDMIMCPHCKTMHTFSAIENSIS